MIRKRRDPEVGETSGPGTKIVVREPTTPRLDHTRPAISSPLPMPAANGPWTAAGVCFPPALPSPFLDELRAAVGPLPPSGKVRRFMGKQPSMKTFMRRQT